MAESPLIRMNEMAAKVNAGQCWHHVFDWGDVLTLLGETRVLQEALRTALGSTEDGDGTYYFTEAETDARVKSLVDKCRTAASQRKPEGTP